MATRALEGRASALPQFAAFAAMLEAIPSLPRPLLSRLTARLIDRLDEIDPDPENEPNGDEQDGSSAEDDWRLHPADGPGCPISDPGGGNVTDEPHDQEHDDEREAWPTIGAQWGVGTA